MAYPIAVGDIVEIKVRYAQSQIVEMFNTLHYRYIGPDPITDGGTAIAALLSYFATTIGTVGWSARWSSTAAALVNIDKYIGQKVYPVRYGQVDLDVNVPGQSPANPLPGLVQWAITKRGELATRYSVGGIRVPGLPEDAEEGSQVAAAARPGCDNLAALMTLTMLPAAGQLWEPIVYRRLNAGSSVRVVEAFAQYVLRSQRTRIAFRGI